jgi:hypothetical protein
MKRRSKEDGNDGPVYFSQGNTEIFETAMKNSGNEREEM